MYSASAFINHIEFVYKKAFAIPSTDAIITTHFQQKVLFIFI